MTQYRMNQGERENLCFSVKKNYRNLCDNIRSSRMSYVRVPSLKREDLEVR